MNFDKNFENLKKRMDELYGSYIEARDFTKSFLDCCQRNGIGLVSIGTGTKLIKASTQHPFGAGGSAFAISKTGNRTAIWEACGEAGVYAGCGNSCQAQLNQKGMAQLIDGVYRLQDGVWERVE